MWHLFLKWKKNCQLHFLHRFQKLTHLRPWPLKVRTAPLCALGGCPVGLMVAPALPVRYSPGGTDEESQNSLPVLSFPMHEPTSVLWEKKCHPWILHGRVTWKCAYGTLTTHRSTTCSISYHYTLWEMWLLENLTSWENYISQHS